MANLSRSFFCSGSTSTIASNHDSGPPSARSLICSANLHADAGCVGLNRTDAGRERKPSIPSISTNAKEKAGPKRRIANRSQKISSVQFSIIFLPRAKVCRSLGPLLKALFNERLITDRSVAISLCGGSRLERPRIRNDRFHDRLRDW